MAVQICAVSILSAVLAHARNVAFDVTGIERRFVEGRIKQLNQSGIAADQQLIHALHRLARAAWIASAADHRPALRQGIDLTFRIGPGAERFSIVEVGAAIPLAVPGMSLDVLLQLPRLDEAAVGKTGIVVRAVGKTG